MTGKSPTKSATCVAVSRCLAAAAAALGMAVLGAPLSSAAPQCTNTTPTTTQCQNHGNTQIVTTPPARNYGPFYGPYLGLGGFSIHW